MTSVCIPLSVQFLKTLLDFSSSTCIMIKCSWGLEYWGVSVVLQTVVNGAESLKKTQLDGE